MLYYYLLIFFTININQNEGAESTLAWLLSLTTFHKLVAENILAIKHQDKTST